MWFVRRCPASRVWAVWSTSLEPGESSALTSLTLRLRGAQIARALRGTVLRIHFDGASRPQVEAPAGDFFATGPGINPYQSLPMSVAPDGTMSCRFPMPFRTSARLTLENTTDHPIEGKLGLRHEPFAFDERTLYFRAKWRADHALVARGDAGPFDVPWLSVFGKGRLVGAACMLHNPARDTLIGSWWGEGDEKIFVDDESAPRFLGTGTEDYFNYAWGHHDLFDGPYCGQTLVTGLFCTGHIANHRFHVLDDLLFDRSLNFAMELWTQRPEATLSYGRIVYHYARPGAVDDHRRLQPGDLVVPGSVGVSASALSPPAADAGARLSGALGMGGRFAFTALADSPPDAVDGSMSVEACPAASGGRVRVWRAQPGQRISWRAASRRTGDCALELTVDQRPDGGCFRVLVGGEVLRLRDGLKDEVCVRGERSLRRFRFVPTHLDEGAHLLVLQCTKKGAIALDSALMGVVRWAPAVIPGAVEAEDLVVSRHSEDLTWARQRGRWHLRKRLERATVGFASHRPSGCDACWRICATAGLLEFNARGTCRRIRQNACDSQRGAKRIGRDHWPQCYSAMMAGAGIRGGSVYGESDKNAAYVKSNPVTLEDFTATLFAAMDINPAARLSPDGFTAPANSGNPIEALL